MGDAPARVGASSAAGAALDAFFDSYYRQRPVTATFTGIHAYDRVLPDWSPDGLARAADEMRAQRRALDAAGRVADDWVTEFPAQTDVALADGALEIALAEHESGHFVHHNPAMWTGEAIFGVLGLVTRGFAPLAQRLDHAQSRLEAIPAFLAQARETMVAAPLDWKSRATQECRAAQTLFGDTLPAWVAARGPDEAAGLDVAQWTRASRAAGAAFAAFETWLALPPPDQRGGVARPDSATPGPVSALFKRRTPATLATAVPEREHAGEALLELLLRRGHFVTTPVPDLLREATAALDEASARLDTMAAPHGGWPAVQELLAAQHPTADGYLARFDEKWRACWQAAQDYKLVTWPMAPLRYVPIPEHTRAAAPSLYYLHYRSPAPFDPFGLFDYVVPAIDGLTGEALEAKLRAVNDSVITLNHVVHHGAIGHHVQNHHAYLGRSRVGKVAAVDTANRISMFSGGSLAEGWACYVCDLMEEIGFLTPLERIAQQHTRVRIAARAVADLSIHTGRFTAAQAAWLYEERAFMPVAGARAEAVRNGMYPGTAVMYWLGTRGLHQLRAEVWARQGAAFSMRAFHDRVLKHGAIPVALIARLMLAEETAS